MGLQLKDLFSPFDLSNKIMSYMKDEGANLNNLINALTNIVLCISFRNAFFYLGKLKMLVKNQ
jgi:hypothetical protein